MNKNKFVIDPDMWIIIFGFIFLVGVCFLISFDVKYEKEKCIENSGKWVKTINTNGSASYFCIPK
jgi:hypothetical protein